ncbi:unnamed protein product [Ectocarpus sp. 13 AM-2016]
MSLRSVRGCHTRRKRETRLVPEHITCSLQGVVIRDAHSVTFCSCRIPILVFK